MHISKGVMFGLGLACSTAWAAVPTSLFDKPLHVEQVSLPTEPDNPQSKPMLSCFYYPHLMVKQVDKGEKGAERLSIIYRQNGKDKLPCRLAIEQNETTISHWEGYFRGVKGDYLFFTGSDSWGGGEPFAIFSTDGEKLFADVAAEFYSVELVGTIQPPEQRPWYENPLILHYRKVYLAPCSLRKDEQQCWNSIKQSTGLAQTTPPDCRASYAREEEQATLNQREAIQANPSMIEYDIEGGLDGNGVIRLFPAGPAIACYAAP